MKYEIEYSCLFWIMVLLFMNGGSMWFISPFRRESI